MSTEDSSVEYREIPGHPNHRVGNDGSVQTRIIPGHPKMIGEWRNMQGSVREGHRLVSIKRPSKLMVYRIAELVLEAFVSPQPKGLYACYRDGNKENLAVGNLYWGIPNADQAYALTEDPNVTYRDVPGWEGYRVGNDGSVWSRWYTHTPGDTRLGDVWKRLKPHPAGTPGKKYLSVCRHGSRYLVHHLVLFAFTGPCPAGMERRHKDGNRLNNRADNLEYGTPEQNAADKKRHGTDSVGERNGSAKLTEEKVREIRRLAGSGVPQQEIARRFGTHQTNIGSIIRRKTWSHVA